MTKNTINPSKLAQLAHEDMLCAVMQSCPDISVEHATKLSQELERILWIFTSGVTYALGEVSEKMLTCEADKALMRKMVRKLLKEHAHQPR